MPRPGIGGRFPELVSVQRLPGRRSRAGAGHGGTLARDGSGWHAGTSVPSRLTVRALSGRTAPARVCTASRPAARAFPASPKGATGGVQPRCFEGAARRPCRRPADTVQGAPSRGAGKAAASSRFALLPRRAGVVSTVSVSERVETTPGGIRRADCNLLNRGDLWPSSASETSFWGRNARKRRLQNGCEATFSPDSLATGEFARPPWNSLGLQAVGSGRVIPTESLAD